MDKLNGGNQMIEVMSQKSSIALRNIVQLNPFDAVAIIKQHNNKFVVEMVNAKATVLFNEHYEPGMLAEDFFAISCWEVVKSCLQQNKGEILSLNLDDKGNIEFLVQNLLVSGQEYYCIIMRLVSEKTNEIIEYENKVKHLYFVEQYVDPVISLDLTGKIIYINKAAERKLSTTETNILGKSIFELLENDYKKQFTELFEKTAKGSPMGLPRLELKNSIFTEEPVYINSFPTYWNGDVIGAHIVIKNITELFKERDAYRYITYYDELTKLFNRRALNDHWQVISENNAKENYAVVLVDIDRFKRFNESLGKKKADMMLAMICERFEKIRTDHCEVYRYNGDEFVFLVRYLKLNEVEIVLQQIFDEVKYPIIFDEQEYYITTSIGVSLSEQNDQVELDKLLHQADQALFHVKLNGRNHYRYYEKGMSKVFPNAALMESHLKRAIEFDELALYLQPQLDLTTGSISSFEALIRWENRKFGSVSPQQFIPLAESSGLILEIGDWVLKRACEYLKEWEEKKYKPVRIAVNISPVQFKQENFVAKLKQMIETYKINPKLLELEITEGSMTDIEETTKILKQLKQLGVYVAVDDFGTGYSSLSYLKMFPVDVIKIDQSFIADISRNEKNEAIIEAIITMSHSLGLEVVAEGVEEKNQEYFLRQHNCQKVQGYLYNRPLPVEEILKLYIAI